MKCLNCQYDNPADALFCQNCGQSLEQKCPNCGTENPSSARFCKQCGTQLSQEGDPIESTEPNNAPVVERTSERRIVTILFCDVKGSTSLAEQIDPEDWTEIMDGAFKLLVAAVDRYEGTVARLMGDGMLAIFGAPVAHEDDPLRAIRAGLDMIQDLRPYQEKVRQRLSVEGVEVGLSDFEVRVGINTGLTVVGAVGHEKGSEYTVMGDAANLAARMEQTALPGTVQISHDTYKLVAPHIDYESLGQVSVKGKREPVPIFRVTGIRRSAVRTRGSAGAKTPLIGRAREMTQLEWALADLDEGRGRIVGLMGEAGLGKSRLISELRRLEKAQDCRWYEVASLSFEGNQPYGLLRRLVRLMAGLTSEESNRQIGKQLQPLLHESLDGRQQEEFQLAISALFGRNPGHDQPSLDGDSLQSALSDGIRSIWLNQASERPLVVAFDDLHWTDMASIQVISNLLSIVTETSVLVISVFRPERESPVWELKERAENDFSRYYTPLVLNPLSDAESDDLVGSLMVMTDLPADFRRLVMEKSEGIPLFIEEIIRELIESGAVDEDSQGDWRITGDITKIELPENLESLLLTRIDRLKGTTRRVAQIAAVIGRSFEHRVLSMVSGVEDDLNAHLDLLQQAGVIQPSSQSAERESEFRHVLTPEAAYNTILRKDRRRYHKRTGDVMVELYEDALEQHAALLAHHYTRAGDQDEALRFYSMAAKNAADLFANREALQHFSQALELADSAGVEDERLPALHHGRGLIHERLGHFEEALADFEAALETAEQAGSQEAEWHAYLELGKLWASRDYDRAGKYFRRALDLARKLEQSASLAESLNRVGNWHINKGEPSPGIDYHQEALSIFDGLEDKSGLAGTHDLLGMANLIAGDMVSSVRHYRQALELFRELEEYRGIVASKSILIQAPGSFLLFTLTPVGDLTAPDVAGREALELARTIGWQAGEAFILAVYASQFGVMGQYGKALETVEESLRIAKDINHTQWITGALMIIGAIYRVIMAFDKARENTEQALDLAIKTGSHFWRHNTTGLLSLIYLELNQQDQALELLDEVLHEEFHFDTIGERICWYARAQLALAQNDPEFALEIINSLIQNTANLEPGDVVSSLWLVKGTALRDFGRIKEAEELLLAGQENSRRRGELTMLLDFYVNLAQLYRRNDRPRMAEDQVDQGQKLIEQLAQTIPDEEMKSNYLDQASRRLRGTSHPARQ